MSRNFMQLLQAQQDKGRFVCVGLDSDVTKLPKFLVEELHTYDAQLAFNIRIINTTKDCAGAYKPNMAFYKGPKGKEVLRQTIEHIHMVAPEIPVILDAKQGDIGNTNDGYVADDFAFYNADAVTVHNFMGMEAMKPFLNQADKGVIVLCRTSNPGAGFIQNLQVEIESHQLAKQLGISSAVSFYMNDGGTQGRPTIPLYEFIAHDVVTNWNYNGNCCVVVGATVPEELARVRDIVGDMPILLPGIGAQGGDVEATVMAGKNSRGQGMIINSSRGIIFASDGEDFAAVARREIKKLHEMINQYR
ncbi:orotidine-5'-phosphate decarboxylase [Candidatus Saccharibacteria bacterium]|nr:orotidine-5'-phosphate decarboxylase [Candidatus Saccharibacteria bacterium]